MQAQNPPALVLDTNVVLDWLIFQDPATAPLATAIETAQVQWIASAAMLDELSHVLRRGGLERWQSRLEPALTFANACVLLVQTPVTGATRSLPCSDPDDQKFIDLALGWPARWLISRDKALLRLARRAGERGTTVCTPAMWRPAESPAQA